MDAKVSQVSTDQYLKTRIPHTRVGVQSNA
jgi:hypothetical protein